MQLIGIKIKMKTNAVIIFAKWPEMGKCKTRIAEKTSPEFALEFSRACLTDLISRVNSERYDLFFGVDSEKEAKLFEKEYSIKGVIIDQSKEISQSDKFNNLFSKLCELYEKVILIPMDLPFLEENNLLEAFEVLDKHSYVVGPEFNGGIYLMGMNVFDKNVFDKVRWSTSSSSQDFIYNCKKSIGILKRRNDLNTIDEVKLALSGISRHCPNLFNLLRNEGYYPFSNKIKHGSLNVVPCFLNLNNMNCFTK